MKSYITFIIATLSIFLTINVLAAPAHYAIIVDAGSSGSRLHLFQYDDSKGFPTIKDIFTEKNSKPLASYASTPDKAYESLQPLLDAAVEKINAAHITEVVPISVLGTAGMRLLTAKEQQDIYDNISDFIAREYLFDIYEMQTISGKQEGIFDWLEVNYLAENFQKNRITVGSIDMGGASTQIAFATQNKSMPDDEINLRINNKNYLVFSKSFLGLGLDLSRMSIDTYLLSDACYPKGYARNGTQQGQFNFDTCDSLYAQLIGKYHVREEILPIESNQYFIAFSGAYYTYQFFNVALTPDETSLQTQIKNMCEKLSWDDMKLNFPNEPQAYLANYCGAGVYLQNLFYHAYGLEGSQLQVLNTIHQQNIDWTMGALLYYLENQP